MKFDILLRNKEKSPETVAMATRILQKRLPWQYAYVLQIFNLSFFLQLVGSPDNILKISYILITGLIIPNRIELSTLCSLQVKYA